MRPPRFSAALDTVWAVWPDMDILDLRNLAFDCAEDMPAPEGETAVTRSYSYANGRTFTSDTNSTWGHGILSLTCLFTPNGGLQDPTTGNAISGGIIGPIAGPVTGALITGIDYTGRDFAYGFARPVARENFALLATTAVQPSKTISRVNALGHGSAVVLSALAKTDRFSLDLTASGNAIGIVSEWRFGRLTFRGGFAAQPEGRGEFDGVARISRTFGRFGGDHRCVRRSTAQWILRSRSGGSLAHVGDVGAFPVGRCAAERVADLRSAGQAHRPA